MAPECHLTALRPPGVSLNGKAPVGSTSAATTTAARARRSRRGCVGQVIAKTRTSRQVWRHLKHRGPSETDVRRASTTPECTTLAASLVFVFVVFVVVVRLRQTSLVCFFFFRVQRETRVRPPRVQEGVSVAVASRAPGDFALRGRCQDRRHQSAASILTLSPIDASEIARGPPLLGIFHSPSVVASPSHRRRATLSPAPAQSRRHQRLTLAAAAGWSNVPRRSLADYWPRAWQGWLIRAAAAPQTPPSFVV